MTINRALLKEDFYQAVNGTWIESAEIPNDKSSVGGFNELRDGVEELLMKDFALMENGHLPLETDELQQMIHYYRQAIDFDKRNLNQRTDIQKYIEAIQQIDSLADFNRLYVDYCLANINIFPFVFFVSQDMKEATRYSLHLTPNHLILPDTTYYAKDNESGKKLLEIYYQMIIDVFISLDFSEEESIKIADNTLTFDTLMVPHHLSREELADYTINYNAKTMSQVQAYHQQIDFNQLATELIGQEVDKIIVTQPKFFEALNTFVTQENLELLKSWMLSQFIISESQLLSEELRQKASQYSLALNGTSEIMNRTKDAYYKAAELFDHVVGDYYGKKYFGEKAKADVREMVITMIDVYKDRLAKNSWLSSKTIQKAIEKLETLDVLVGYPDHLPEIFSQLKVNMNQSFYENTKQLLMILNKYQFSKWNTEVDRSEWGMSAATVNAYFHPMNNHICFPAAILQAPFYSIEQSRSQNYGGIGAVIAHEISHAFDNNGAKFDKYGNLENWWSDQDYEVFNEKTQIVINQWDGLDFAGGKVNGKLTVSENIADGGGLKVALEALKREESYSIEAFFINWAKIWCRKARQEYKELLLSIDVHSPNELRTNMQVKNFDEFHETFDTKPGDAMYLEPEKRILVW